MGIRISELESTNVANANDVFIINQSGTTKKITKDDLQSQIGNPELEERVAQIELDTGTSLELSMNTSTYVLTANLKNKDDTVVSTATVDLPLESLVKDIQYDSTTKEIVFILQDGTTRRIPLSDLISGLQAEITEQNKLSSDLVDDTNKIHKFVTASEKTSWNDKYNKPITGIPKTDLANDVQTSLNKADTAIQEHQDITGKEDKSNKTTELTSESTDIQYPSAKAVYDSQAGQNAEIQALQTKVANLEETVNSELEDGTAEGTEITVNDSATADGSIVTNGNTSQNQYEGYNRCRTVYPFESQKSGVICKTNEDGSITLNGLSTAEGTSGWFCFSVADKTIKKNNTLSVHYVSGSMSTSGTGRPRISIFDSNYRSSLLLNFPNLSKSTTVLSATYNKDTEFTLAMFYVDINSGDSFDNFTFKVMLTDEVKTEFEPYVGGQASPNPEFPQNIEVVKGNVDIKVSNNNWFDFNKLLDEYSNLIEGNAEKFTAKTKDTRINIGNNYKEKTQYSIQGNYSTTLANGYMRILYSDGSSDILFQGYTNASMQGTFSTKSAINKSIQTIQIISYGTTAYWTIDKLQIEIGTSATDYVPHEEQTITITLPNGLEMCKIGDYRDEFVKNLNTNKWYKHKAVDKKIFDGSENWYVENTGTSSWFYRTQLPYIPVQEHGYCTHYSKGIISASNTEQGFICIAGDRSLRIRYGTEDTVANYKTWLSTHNVTLYYLLQTPIEEEITDETLINELEELLKIRTYYGQTNVTVEAEDLAPYMTLNYKKSNRALRSEIDTIKARLDLLEN